MTVGEARSAYARADYRALVRGVHVGFAVQLATRGVGVLLGGGTHRCERLGRAELHQPGVVWVPFGEVELAPLPVRSAASRAPTPGQTFRGMLGSYQVLTGLWSRRSLALCGPDQLVYVNTTLGHKLLPLRWLEAYALSASDQEALL